MSGIAARPSSLGGRDPEGVTARPGAGCERDRRHQAVVVILLYILLDGLIGAIRGLEVEDYNAEIAILDGGGVRVRWLPLRFLVSVAERQGVRPPRQGYLLAE